MCVKFKDSPDFSTKMCKLIEVQSVKESRHMLVRTGCDIPMFGAYAIAHNFKELLSPGILDAAKGMFLIPIGGWILSTITGINRDHNRYFEAT